MTLMTCPNIHQLALSMRELVARLPRSVILVPQPQAESVGLPAQAGS